MSKRYKSDLAESIHQSAQALFRVGAIDKATLSDFDAACLAPPQPQEAATHPIGTRLIQEEAKIALEDADVVLPSRYDDRPVSPEDTAGCSISSLTALAFPI